MSLNLCQFIGNCGKDPEIRAMNSGDEIANLSVAVTETWKDKSGEKKEKTEWVKVVIFNKHLVELAKKYITKGSKLYISGKMQTRKWQDSEGADRYSTEIVMGNYDGQIQLLGSKSSSDGGNYEAAKSNGYQPEQEVDDEIPF